MPTRQKIRAYLWLFFIFCTLAGANFFFFRFSFHEQNSIPLTRGLAFASSLWSTVLFVAMLLRRGWARYVLITLLVLAMVGFGLAELVITSQSLVPVPGVTKNVIAGLVLCGLALTPLGISRSLRRFLAPRTAGGK